MKYVIFLLGIALVAGLFFLLKIDYNQLNPLQKYIAERIYKKWDEKINTYPKDERAIVSYDELMDELSIFERIFALRVFSIDPKELGFKGPFYSKDRPGKLIKISSVRLELAGKEYETGVQFYPEAEYNDYLKMMSDMKAAIGKVLYVDSGYRSPGRQAYLFFKYLVTSSKYSLKENSRWIAMPGYSEHGNPRNTSIDFVNQDGINGIDDSQSAADFEKLQEFSWLKNNAYKYNFYNSYPKDNPYGVAFEPWHWHWEKRTIQTR